MHEQDHSHVDYSKPIFDDFGRMNIQAMVNRDTPVLHAKEVDERGHAKDKNAVEKISSAEAHKRASKDEHGNPAPAAGAAGNENAQLKTELEQLKKELEEIRKKAPAEFMPLTESAIKAAEK